jgi:hypothetical protein
MSWLKKIVSKLSAQNVEQVVEEVLDTMPTAQCLTAQAVEASEPAPDEEDESPIKQRRYFVKKGLYVDNEEERAAARVAESKEEIADRSPVDLRTLFPKLSLR